MGFLEMSVSDFFSVITKRIRRYLKRSIVKVMLHYRKKEVFTSKEQKLRKLVIRISSMQDSDLYYFPLTDAAMIQTKDKKESVLLEAERLVYTNTKSYIENSVRSVFYRSLLTDVKWRIEKRRYELRDIVFEKHMSIIDEVLQKYQ